MKKTVSFLIFGLVSCSLSPKKLDQLNAENNYYSPVEAIEEKVLKKPKQD